MTESNVPVVMSEADAFDWNRQKLFAETIASTEFVPRTYRGNVPAILACINYGRELGIGPMESLQVIDIIDGKASQSAELMVSQVRAAGHSILPKELTDKVCTVVGKRSDTGDEMAFTFTWEMAKRAELTAKSNWRKYPEAMLWARAVSQLCRMLFADVISGVSYTSEELGSISDAGPETLEGVVVEMIDDAGESTVADGADVALEVGDLDIELPELTEHGIRAHLSDMPADKATKEDQVDWIRKLFAMMDEAGFPKWGESGLRAAVMKSTGEPPPPQATTGLGGLRKEDVVSLKGEAWTAAEFMVTEVTL